MKMTLDTTNICSHLQRKAAPKFIGEDKLCEMLKKESFEIETRNLLSGRADRIYP